MIPKFHGNVKSSEITEADNERDRALQIRAQAERSMRGDVQPTGYFRPALTSIEKARQQIKQSKFMASYRRNHPVKENV